MDECRQAMAKEIHAQRVFLQMVRLVWGIHASEPRKGNATHSLGRLSRLFVVMAPPSPSVPIQNHTNYPRS